MAIQVALNHKTHYHFDQPVALSPHVIRLRPAPHCRTPVRAYSLRIVPEQHFINWQQDPFGNYLARIVFPERTTELGIEVDLIAEMTVINPFDFFLEDSAECFPFTYDAQIAKELSPSLEICEHGDQLKAWIARVDCSRKRTVDFLVYLNQRLQADIGYIVRLEPGVQTCEETLTRRTGSCRDTAWLLVQILRHLGLAARFVSGYLVQLTPDIKALDGPAGPSADFTDLHAWAEVYVPGAGWIGLDPTSGLFAGEGHIPLACAPDPQSAAPVTGARDVCEVELVFSNTVQRVREQPRVTKPYTPSQWDAIDRLGRQVDRDLLSSDVRLTVGGEPTFVALENVDAAEWNIDALGPTKRALADALLKRLARQFATGPLLHYGQGKWYPGEPLPRWALSCLWRKDGVPVWRNAALIADDNRDYGFGIEQARSFLEALTRRLHVDAAHIAPGYEDVYYYLWKEGTLPANIDPLQSNLKDSLERKRLTWLLEQGLGNIVGFALPLQWGRNAEAGEVEGWRSGAWEFRRGRMYLLPGDSPMGYRLPLDSLPWIHPEERAVDPVRCLFEPRPPLGDYFGEVTRRYSQFTAASATPASSAGERISEQHLTGSAPPALPGVPGGSTAGPSGGPAVGMPEQVVDHPRAGIDIARVALCVEPRQGRLHVFLPPVSHLEHFLDLIAVIESTAAELSLPVVIEGYLPPHDYRLQKLQVTPDPGVIEVNMHPAHDWGEVLHNTVTLYEEAHLCRLTTEKFMLDGRHTGTGGGNHVTLGGETPADSPMLRRPDVLQSLLTFWQHHPSLSYLFAGMFIGPTSQMPRIDEARNDSLHELEIAFQNMPRDGAPFPWLVDRLLRNLVVDVTGNTHRTEFCIDKLFSPDSLAGRLGIVEMRAFEMPPHPRMSAVQVLLIRALIAHFWNAPYKGKLVNWGTELHDRFMLPHYVWQDFKEVLDALHRSGYEFDAAWFQPFLEFRFPQYGAVQIQDIELELRMAIEPWHVLGEEVTSSGTARYVDSSVERLQVKLNGMTDTRHTVLCNGRHVPLRPTGTRGEYVAGVRYRAWQPPSALHPTIPVHAPLVFDLLDTWTGRSLGGCTYHVEHPGGRNSELVPINANEAESRRLARFWPFGHTPGPLTPPTEEPNRDFPHTLDLRRQRD